MASFGSKSKLSHVSVQLLRVALYILAYLSAARHLLLPQAMVVSLLLLYRMRLLFLPVTLMAAELHGSSLLFSPFSWANFVNPVQSSR